MRWTKERLSRRNAITAIPAVIAYNYFLTRIRRSAFRMDSVVVQLYATVRGATRLPDVYPEVWQRFVPHVPLVPGYVKPVYAIVVVVPRTEVEPTVKLPLMWFAALGAVPPGAPHAIASPWQSAQATL